MNKLLLSLIILGSASLMANPLTPKLEQAFKEEFKKSVSRNNVRIKRKYGKVHDKKPAQAEYNLGKNPEGFARFLEEMPSTELGFAIAKYIKKTNALKELLVQKLRKAIIATKHLKHDEEEVLRLISYLDIFPSIYLSDEYSYSEISSYQFTYVSVDIAFHAKNFCAFTTNSDYSLEDIADDIAEGINKATSHYCLRQIHNEMDNFVEKFVNEAEKRIIYKNKARALKEKLENDRAKLREALDDDEL